MAVGNSKHSLNKVFIFDYASGIDISAMYLPRNDFILFGLVLLDLNGVKFPPLGRINRHATIDEISESLINKWDWFYAKVK